MPNGATFSCSNCHLNPGGGGARNAFGEAVNSIVSGGNQSFWTAALAAMDSDGDGFTNGQELGDPDGDGVANSTQSIANPGNANSTPSANPPNITSHPQSKTSIVGQSVTFELQVQGDAPFTYAWLKNGNVIEGEESSTLTINSVTEADAGAYSIRVTNAAGTVVSNQAQLTVLVLPQISKQPSSLRLATGTASQLSVQATGSAPLSYQWYQNDNAISGATSSNLSFSALSPNDTGQYRVDVTNAAGTISSDTVEVAVLKPVSIDAQPASLVVNQTETAVFTVTASGTDPITYQWFKDGVALTDQTGKDLTIQSADIADAGNYFVEVKNELGSLNSETAVLNVQASLTILNQPSSQTVNQNQAVTFNVAASGSGNITYQWLKNGTPISGKTEATLTLPSAQTADAGSYSVEVRSEQNTLTSEVAVLTVIEIPTILGDVEILKRLPETSFESNIQVTGSEPLNYQWQRNGIILEDQTNPQISIDALSIDDVGIYSVTITNQAGTVSAEVFSLEIIAPPSMVTIASPPILAIGQALTLKGDSDGSLPKTFQWFKNGAAISGAISEQLHIASLGVVDAGVYQLKVTNEAGSHTSEAIEVQILTPPTIFEHPQSISKGLGETATFRVTASGSEPLAFQWKHFGTIIPSADKSELAITEMTEDDLGSYTVEVSNPVGSVTSLAANLSLRRGPNLIKNPVSIVVTEGDTATFIVEAESSGTITYQWVSGIVLLPGETSSTFTIDRVNASHAGEYSVFVTDSTGTLQSQPAKLTVSSLSNHPADISPIDFVISFEEWEAYQSAWKSSTPWETGPKMIPMAEVVHATALVANGGGYRLDPASTIPPNDRWQPNGENAPTISEWIRSGTISRTVIPPTGPGELAIITIVIQPTEGLQAWAFEEHLPPDIEPVHFAASSQWNPDQQKLKWGPFTADAPFVLSYELPLSSSELSSIDWNGEVSWAGKKQLLQETTLIPETSQFHNSHSARFTQAKDQVIVFISVEEDGTYLIESSNNLNHWKNLTNTESSNGRLLFIDQKASNDFQRFYRYFITTE